MPVIGYLVRYWGARVSFCSLSWFGTHYVTYTVLKLMLVYLHQPSECWNYRQRSTKNLKASCLTTICLVFTFYQHLTSGLLKSYWIAGTGNPLKRYYSKTLAVFWEASMKNQLFSSGWL